MSMPYNQNDDTRANEELTQIEGEALSPLEVHIVQAEPVRVEHHAADVASMETYGFSVTGTTQLRVLSQNPRRSRAVITLNAAATGVYFLCKQRELANIISGGSVGYAIFPGESFVYEASPEVWAVGILAGGNTGFLRVTDEWYKDE